MLKFLICSLLIATVHCLVFDDPLIDTDFTEPCVIRHNGQYYTVSRPLTNSAFNVPIRTTYDLRNWETISYVFDDTNIPSWFEGDTFYSPELHVIDDQNFRVYFSAYENETGYEAIGVAYADDIRGPYVPLEQPLVVNGPYTSVHPTLLNTNGELYLIWSASSRIVGRKLNSGGLSFADDSTSTLFSANQQWENGNILAPYAVQRGDTYYAFYSTSINCNNGTYGVGVARSTSPLGPYEKKDGPILVADSVQQLPGQVSVAKYADGETDLLFFHSYKPEEGCGHYRYLYVRALTWDNDGWPNVNLPGNPCVCSSSGFNYVEL